METIINKTAVLEVRGVTKIYSSKKRKITAVENLSFEVNAGEIVGFIGPNGAGKSTAIKMAVGLANPTDGDIYINGYSIKKDRIKALEKVGCIVENPDFYLRKSAIANLRYFLSLYKFDKSELNGYSIKEYYDKRAEDLLAIVGLSDRKNDKVDTYSLGMKQRLGIAQALLNKPSLLILDEPTNGLDPAGIKEVRDILQKLATEYNMAILVSSHLLAEIQLVCDRYVVINRGKLVGQYTQNDIAGTAGSNTVILTTDDVVKAKDILAASLGINAVIIGNGRVQFNTDSEMNEITQALLSGGVTIIGIAKKERTLEEFFMGLTSNIDLGGGNV